MLARGHARINSACLTLQDLHRRDGSLALSSTWNTVTRAAVLQIAANRINGRLENLQGCLPCLTETELSAAINAAYGGSGTAPPTATLPSDLEERPCEFARTVCNKLARLAPQVFGRDFQQLPCGSSSCDACSRSAPLRAVLTSSDPRLTVDLCGEDDGVDCSGGSASPSASWLGADRSHQKRSRLVAEEASSPCSSSLDGGRGGKVGTKRKRAMEKPEAPSSICGDERPAERVPVSETAVCVAVQLYEPTEAGPVGGRVEAAANFGAALAYGSSSDVLAQTVDAFTEQGSRANPPLDDLSCVVDSEGLDRTATVPPAPPSATSVADSTPIPSATLPMWACRHKLCFLASAAAAFQSEEERDSHEGNLRTGLGHGNCRKATREANLDPSSCELCFAHFLLKDPKYFAMHGYPDATDFASALQIVRRSRAAGAATAAPLPAAAPISTATPPMGAESRLAAASTSVAASASSSRALTASPAGKPRPRAGDSGVAEKKDCVQLTLPSGATGTLVLTRLAPAGDSFSKWKTQRCPHVLCPCLPSTISHPAFHACQR